MSLAKVSKIRDSISDIKAVIREVQTAPVTEAEAHERIENAIRAWGSLFDSSWIGMNLVEANGGTPDYLIMERAMVGNVSPAVLLAAVAPEPLRLMMRDSIKPYVGGGITAEERESRIAELEKQLYELEVEEEQLISKLEDDGVEIYRRHDIDPSIVLSV